jgi:hypothetical protein
MATEGSRHSVGTAAPDTGQYRHSNCTNTEIFNKGNILAPCANRACSHRGADWVLVKKLT